MARTAFRRTPTTAPQVTEEVHHSTTTIERPTRPTRPVRPQRPQAEPELKGGGWMSNPPETCKKRVFDGASWFIDVTLCAYHCSLNVTCKVWSIFQEGSKQRKRFTADEEPVEAPKPKPEPVQAPATKINRLRR